MSNTPQQVLTWSCGLAIILFCLTGIASILGWIPDSLNGKPSGSARQESIAPDSPLVQGECLNCGVIATTCVLDLPDDEHFMAGLVNVSGVLGPGLVDAVSGGAAPATDKARGLHYQTTVRFNNGTTRAFAATNEPKWQVGERVRVTRGVIQPQG